MPWPKKILHNRQLLLPKSKRIGNKLVNIAAKVYVHNYHFPASVKQYLFGPKFEEIIPYIIKATRSIVFLHVHFPQAVNCIFTITDLCAMKTATEDSVICCGRKLSIEIHNNDDNYKVCGFVVEETKSKFKIELVGIVSARRFERFRRGGNNNQEEYGNDGDV